MIRSLIVCLVLMAASCGSVGSKGNDAGDQDARMGTGGSVAGTGGGIAGTGGSVAGTGGAIAGTGGAIAGTGGTVTVDAGGGGDAAVDHVSGDAAGDAGPLPTSCQQIKQQDPSAASGVFTIAPLGTAMSVYCEMTVDNGGWTAFYVGDNGAAPGGAHFETAADACPDPANSCLRRLPVTVDATHDFAVKCGAAVVKFKLGAMSLDYFQNGLEHSWQPLTNAVTIDIVNVGKSNLVTNVWTGDSSGANAGWIVAGDQNTVSTAFGNGYTANANWNYCNGAADATSRVMLLYR